MKIPVILHIGKIEVNEYWTKRINQACKDVGGSIRGFIDTNVVESKNQRAFYHGAIIPLWAYLNDLDYRDHKILEQVHIILATEFNGELLIAKGKSYKVPTSTKGKLNKGYMEAIIDNMVENYAIDPMKVLDIEEYKRFRDTIFPYSDIDNFITYMIKKGLLK